MSNESGKLPDFIKFEGVPADSDVLTIVDFDEDQSKFITMSNFLSEIQAGRGVGKTEATNMITEQYIKWYLNDDYITAKNINRLIDQEYINDIADTIEQEESLSSPIPAYETINDAPLFDIDNGDFAFIRDTKRWMMWYQKGWYSIAEGEIYTLILFIRGTAGVIEDTKRFGNSNIAIDVYGDTYASVAEQSIIFDGNGDYIRIDDALSGLFEVSSFTIEVEIKPPLVQSDVYFIAFNSLYDGENILLVGYDSFWINSNQYLFVDQFSEDEWQSIKYTYDGETGNHRFYRNGALIFGRDTDKFSVDPETCSFSLGAEFDAADGGLPGNYFSGSMRNIKMTHQII